MPINGKLLRGPNFGVPPKYTGVQKAEAMKNGAETFRKGGNYENCPPRFRPKPGDKVLSEMWVTGFEAAKIAATARA